MDVPYIDQNIDEFFQDALDGNFSGYHGLFYRRVVANALDSSLVDLAVFKDGELTDIHVELDPNELNHLLRDSLKYFEAIEEYETCQLIFEILKED
jgi:hypothetical protein